jgi:basic membrane lipoprotein Med (substrate-binding protein (PBP1-ABC) superfamily)
MPGLPSTRPAPDLPPGPRAALVIATSAYADPELSQLRAPARDADELVQVLADPDVAAFTVTPLINQPEPRIRRAIGAFLADRGTDDLVLVYLSCHGLLDKRGRLYFAAADTAKTQLGATALESAWLLDQLDECRARRQVLILDCCFSGAFARGSKGDLDLQQRLAGQGRGRSVLTASRAGEYSFEGRPLPGQVVPGSVFTDALIEGIRTGAADADGDGYVTLDEAYSYAFERVRQGSEQTPQRWLYGAEGSLVLARNPAGISIKPARIPRALQNSLDSQYPGVRIGAVNTLAEWLTDPDPGRVLTAYRTLHDIADYDAPAVATAARGHLRASALAADAPPALATEPRPVAEPETPAEPEAVAEAEAEAEPKTEPGAAAGTEVEAEAETLVPMVATVVPAGLAGADALAPEQAKPDAEEVGVATQEGVPSAAAATAQAADEAGPADGELDVTAAIDPSRAGTTSTDVGQGQPARLRRRGRPALLALSGVIILAVAGTVAAVILTSSPNHGSGGSPSHGSATSLAAKFNGCLVTGTGGINDRSFNASSWQGMEAAAAANPNITVKYLQSTTQNDYVSNINTFLGQKCGIIVTVGSLMGAATETAAKANPSQNFAIVDCSYASGCLTGTKETNIDQLAFNTVQDGFLGGYLAAGMTKTGKVATFGGEDIGTVTIYMDGFWDGVQYYNEMHGTNVQVLGWNEQTQEGSFTGDFTNQTKGQTLTETFISEGADIIFPVAGNVGLGAAKAVQQADQAAGSDKVNMFWVDTDGCVSAAQYCSQFITSVEKGIVAAVKNWVLTAAQGAFAIGSSSGTYVGTLSNGGVGLAPFHDFASKIPASLQSDLNQVKAGIENGTIQTPTKSPV